jgi:ATP synthase protein I
MKKMQNDYRFWKSALGLFGAGSVLVGGVVFGYFVGVFLDKKFGTEPYLMVIFFLLGATAGFVEMFRIVKKYIR